MIPFGWFEVHDAEDISKKRPEGTRMLVQASSIDAIRPYASGNVRCILWIGGAFLHVAEDEETITARIAAATNGEEWR